MLLSLRERQQFGDMVIVQPRFQSHRTALGAISPRFTGRDNSLDADTQRSIDECLEREPRHPDRLPSLHGHIFVQRQRYSHRSIMMLPVKLARCCLCFRHSR